MKPYLTKPATFNSKGRLAGRCMLCGQTATKEAFFREPGIIVVQRYCDNCLPKATR